MPLMEKTVSQQWKGCFGHFKALNTSTFNVDIENRSCGGFNLVLGASTIEFMLAVPFT